MLQNRNCELIRIIVPEADDELLKGLGLQEDRYDRDGRIKRISGSCLFKTGFATPSMHGGDWTVSEHLRGELLRKKDQLPLDKEKYPLIFSAIAHGANRMIDSPMAAYAVETYLQGKGIPYEVTYGIGRRDVVFEVEGSEVRQLSEDV
jgi:hypothetical protein